MSMLAPAVLAAVIVCVSALSVPHQVVIDKMRTFEDAYNADDMTKAASVYAPDCKVTVNGGKENGGPFTGHSPKEIAGFLSALRNKMGGTNIQFAITKVEDSVHDDVWVADNGAGTCKATWAQVKGEWMIVRDEIQFTPKAGLDGSSRGVPHHVVFEKMRKFEDAYNADDMAKAASIYAPDCKVTVNGGKENGGPFTGHSPEDVAGFLSALRNKMGGTNIKFAVTKVEGKMHDDVWTADNGAGSCKATWAQVKGEWMIVQDDIQFTPKVPEESVESKFAPEPALAEESVESPMLNLGFVAVAGIALALAGALVTAVVVRSRQTPVAPEESLE